MIGSKEMITGLYEPLEKKSFMIINRYHTQKKFDEFKSEVSDIFDGSVLGLKCFCDEAEVLGNQIITLDDPSHPLSKSIQQLAQGVDKVS
jgi:MinD-like ATPase involved in chromosome partitioning or flagellar assembly